MSIVGRAKKELEALTKEGFITPSQAARELEVCSRTVTRYGDSGLLDVVRTPYGRLFNREQVKALAAKRRELIAA